MSTRSNVPTSSPSLPHTGIPKLKYIPLTSLRAPRRPPRGPAVHITDRPRRGPPRPVERSRRHLRRLQSMCHPPATRPDDNEPFGTGPVWPGTRWARESIGSGPVLAGDEFGQASRVKGEMTAQVAPGDARRPLRGERGHRLPRRHPGARAPRPRSVPRATSAPACASAPSSAATRLAAGRLRPGLQRTRRCSTHSASSTSRPANEELAAIVDQRHPDARSLSPRALRRRGRPSGTARGRAWTAAATRSSTATSPAPASTAPSSCSRPKTTRRSRPRCPTRTTTRS